MPLTKLDDEEVVLIVLSFAVCHPDAFVEAYLAAAAAAAAAVPAIVVVAVSAVSLSMVLEALNVSLVEGAEVLVLAVVVGLSD